jgi:peptidoglycan/xylan/chitin deacetylase (PgdA/CDA1 family)
VSVSNRLRWKRSALRILQASGLFTLARTGSANMARILTYHNFSAAESSDARAITFGNLREQLRHLKNHFYVVPLAHIVRQLQSGGPLGSRMVALTIDDGRRNCYEFLFPLLKEFQMPATFFVVSSFVRGEDWIWTDKVLWLSEQASPPEELSRETIDGFFGMLNQMRPEVRNQRIEILARSMNVPIPKDAPSKYAPCSWSELREMADSGLVEIGSHTVTHPILASITDEESWLEITGSRTQIEEGTGRKVESFCFPNGKPGDYRPSQVRMLKDAGYRCAVVTRFGMVSRNDDLCELPRIGVSGETDALLFAKQVDGAEYYQSRLRAAAGTACGDPNQAKIRWTNASQVQSEQTQPRTMDYKILHDFPATDLEQAWRDCLTRVDCPSHYNAPEYFLEPYWRGQKKFAVLATEGKAVTGAITGLHNGRFINCGLLSRPQICIDSTKDAETVCCAVVRGLLSEARKVDLVDVYTWAHDELPAFSRMRFRRRELAGNVVLDLTQGADALFKQFPKDRRRNIRFAEKNGVEVKEATTARDILDAYEVYQAWFRTERKEIHGNARPFEIFERAARLIDNRVIFVARFSGKPVGMNIFRFFPGGLFESSANSSLDEYMHLKPNDLLQWRGIQWACAHGMRRHSLGGAHSFLRRFGGTVVPILRYRLDRTLLRRYHLKESMRDIGRATAEMMFNSLRGKMMNRASEDHQPGF